MFLRSYFASFASACLMVAATSTHVIASPIVFDFEDQAQTGFNGGALTSLPLTRHGLSMTITRPGTPSRFDVYDVNDIGNPTFPASWGTRSISPWFSNAGTAFVANFSKPVQSVSIDMGDFGGDPDDLFVQAYSGLDATGTLLDSATSQLPLGGGDWTAATLQVSAAAPAIWSVRFMGGTENFETPFGTFSVPNSVYYDNFTAVVPEPASLSLLGFGIAGLAIHTVRRRSRDRPCRSGRHTTSSEFMGRSNMTTSKLHVRLALLGLAPIVFLCVGRSSHAGSYKFTTFDLPDAGSVLLNGLNNAGDLAGQATFPPGLPTAQGFVARSGAPDFFNPPGSEATAVMDLNDDGITVGWSFQDPSFLTVRPFVRDAAGQITTPDLTPILDVDDIEFNKINNHGVIVGGALDFEFVPTFSVTSFAFVIDAADPTNPLPSEMSLIDLAGVDQEFAWGINDLGSIVGTASENGTARGFLLDPDRTSFELFDIPGASLTRPRAINDLGQIVGTYRLASTGSQDYSFLLNPDGTWIDLIVPGSATTLVRDINEQGTIVGTYIDPSGMARGFTAMIIPEPSSIVLAAFGLWVPVVLLRRRARQCLS